MVRLGTRFAVAPLLAVAVGGCASSHVASAAKTGTVQVAVTEYRLRPNDVRAVAGPVTLVVHNVGRLTHDLVVGVPGATAVAAATGPIRPGEKATLVVTLPAGSYTLKSTIGSDASLGARGMLRVYP